MNRKEENDHGRTDTPEVRPSGRRLPPPCPIWCERHEDFDDSRFPEDHARVHWGAEDEVTTFSIQLNRHDWLREGRPGPVVVMFRGEPLTIQQATALAGRLAWTAAKDEPDSGYVVRTINLPEGEDYVVFDEIAVVGVSSRLDEQKRREVLGSLGLS